MNVQLFVCESFGYLPQSNCNIKVLKKKKIHFDPTLLILGTSILATKFLFNQVTDTSVT